MTASPLDCWTRGGLARFEREGRWSEGCLYAAVKHWRGKEPELVHRREEHTLVLTLAGGTSLTGNKITATPLYEGTDRPGCLSFVPAGAERRGWYRDADMEFVALVIAPSFLARFELEDGELPAFTNRRDRLLEAVLRGLAEEMRAEPEQRLPTAYVEQAAGLVMSHLTRVQRRIRVGRRREPLGLSGAGLARVVDFVESELDRDLSLSELGGLVGMGPDLFARHFKAQMGMPPYRYILERRLQRAREALREGSMPIAQIALALGFCSQSHFAHAFRKHVGIAPGAYRRTA
jgi:AraC family transcriptional regulator